MNLLLLSEDDFIREDLVRLYGRRAEYLRECVKRWPGKVFRVGKVRGPLGTGRLREVEGESVVLEVQFSDPPVSLPLSQVHLVIALPRPQILKKVLEYGASFGVERMVFIRSERSQKSYFHSKLLQPERTFYHLALGLEQAAHTHLPRVEYVYHSGDFWRNHFVEFSAFPAKFLLHPTATSYLFGGVSFSSLPVVCAIGPEGGWSEEELRRFVGFQPIGLGPNIFRVEVAVCALLAQLQGLFLQGGGGSGG